MTSVGASSSEPDGGMHGDVGIPHRVGQLVGRERDPRQPLLARTARYQ